MLLIRCCVRYTSLDLGFFSRLLTWAVFTSLDLGFVNELQGCGRAGRRILDFGFTLTICFVFSGGLWLDTCSCIVMAPHACLSDRACNLILWSFGSLQAEFIVRQLELELATAVVPSHINVARSGDVAEIERNVMAARLRLKLASSRASRANKQQSDLRKHFGSIQLLSATTRAADGEAGATPCMLGTHPYMLGTPMHAWYSP